MRVWNSPLVNRNWTFKVGDAEIRAVEAERARLSARNPGVEITRADALRSLIARAAAVVEGEDLSGLIEQGEAA